MVLRPEPISVRQRRTGHTAPSIPSFPAVSVIAGPFAPGAPAAEFSLARFPLARFPVVKFLGAASGRSLCPPPRQSDAAH